MVAEAVVQHKQWVARNPLRLWRQANGITIDQAAGILGVNFRTVQYWEYGSGVPSGRNFLRLQEVLDEPVITARWSLWLADRPNGGVQ